MIQAQPQGIEAIMQALSTGGMPSGQLGKLPSPANPQAQLEAQAGNQGGQPLPTGAPQSGAIDPLQEALAGIDPQKLELIIQALLGQGAFNQQTPVG